MNFVMEKILKTTTVKVTVNIMVYIPKTRMLLAYKPTKYFLWMSIQREKILRYDMCKIYLLSSYQCVWDTLYRNRTMSHILQTL